MLKKYGNYKFDLDKDCFIDDDNNERIYIKTNEITYIASFVDKDGTITLELEDDTADKLDRQIELVAEYKTGKKDLDNFKEILKKVKIRDNSIRANSTAKVQNISNYIAPPGLEEIKNTYNKSKKYIDDIENNSLVNKIKKLEERVELIENSLEDLQHWRNS